MARSTPVYRVLIEPVLFMGVDRRVAMFNVFVGFAFVLGMQWVWFIPITLITHIVLRYYHRKDAQMREVYMVFKRQASRYDPWWHPYDKAHSGLKAHYHRKAGLGRDYPC